VAQSLGRLGCQQHTFVEVLRLHFCGPIESLRHGSHLRLDPSAFTFVGVGWGYGLSDVASRLVHDRMGSFGFPIDFPAIRLSRL